jgi:hypothetical protein
MQNSRSAFESENSCSEMATPRQHETLQTSRLTLRVFVPAIKMQFEYLATEQQWPEPK